MNPLLVQILNTPSLKDRGFRVRKDNYGYDLIRDSEGYCPLCALAQEQGKEVSSKTFPYSSLFPEINNAFDHIESIVFAADSARDSNPVIREFLIDFLCDT